MNRLRGSRSLSQMLRRYHYQPASPCPSVRGFRSLPLVRPAVHPSSTVSAPLHGNYGTASRRSFVLRWYHDPRKVAAATAITLSPTVMAVRSRYDRQIVPCTNRSHLVVCSLQEERDLGDSQFATERDKFEILDSSDPRSIRVRLITQRIIHAANRGLGIYDSNDSPMLRVTQKWGMPRSPQPHTSHLREINWEVFVAKNDAPDLAIAPSGKILVSIGLLDLFKTDDELAFALAHEVGHVIARHTAEEINHWFPTFLNRFSSRRMEIEADHIGTLLLGAAGFHPQWALVALVKLANKFEGASLLEHVLSDFPKTEKRLRLLSEGKAMKEALELYREVTAMVKVSDQYYTM